MDGSPVRACEEVLDRSGYRWRGQRDGGAGDRLWKAHAVRCRRGIVVRPILC